MRHVEILSHDFLGRGGARHYSVPIATDVAVCLSITLTRPAMAVKRNWTDATHIFGGRTSALLENGRRGDPNAT